MAKGLEDTAFYVYNRLASLNEVGGHPEQFGHSVVAFHRQNQERREHWPHSLLSTSTHDTKRSEDVRARVNVLSELPEEWRAALDRWSRLNAPRKTRLNGDMAPDRNDEYLLYQTLLGAWPEAEMVPRKRREALASRVAGGSGLSPATTEPNVKPPLKPPLPPEELAHLRERIAAYMQKATKEAKVHTSWVNANDRYDAAVRSFVHRLLSEESSDFLADLAVFQHRVAFYGRFNSLSQTLLKLASPGVPDLYQGTELWDLSLVDPDNRRPVDYQRRKALLAAWPGRWRAPERTWSPWLDSFWIPARTGGSSSI
jgi:(1->4)-alpha-D-glucan 1-alpha-D-glucosylmutase